MTQKRRPSLLGALLWTALGLLFLLRNFGIGPDVWATIGRYWPVLLILLGLGKILEYFLKKDAVAIRIGEIIGILILLLIGSAISRISESQNFSRIIQEIPLEIGGTPVRPGQWFGNSHTYTEEVTFPIDPALPIRIENSYGQITVAPGTDREIRARLRKVVYAEEGRAKSFATEIHLLGGPENRGSSGVELKAEAEPGKKSGSGTFVLRTNRDALPSRDIMFNTDIEVLVPKDAQVQVANTYGEVRATGINGKLDLSTTHRQLEVRDCSGQLNATTRYAECRLSNYKGNVTVDARGKIYIDTIKGDVKVTNEYSPSEIFNVDGNLNVSVTEGSLKIEKVTRPVTIEARGTKVELAQLQDTLKIRTSHRSIDITDVASAITVESRYSTLSLKKVKGSVSIDSNSDNISADDIGGPLVLKAKGSGIRVDRVQGPLDIQTTLKEVVVNDFGNSCRISNEYAPVSISSQKLGNGDLTVKSRNGDVELYLPEGASFSLDATARNGSVDSDYSGLAPVTSANSGSLKARVKSGSPRITIETDSSDIHVYRMRDNKESAEEEALAPRDPQTGPLYHAFLRPRFIVV